MTNKHWSTPKFLTLENFFNQFTNDGGKKNLAKDINVALDQKVGDVKKKYPDRIIANYQGNSAER